MKYLILLSALSAAISALAAEPPKLDLKPPALRDTITAKEGIVTVRGQRYRRLEIKGKTYFLQLQQPDDAPRIRHRTEQIRGCREGPPELQPETNFFGNLAEPPRLEGEVKVVALASAYVRALERDCEAYELRPSDVELGLKMNLSEGKDLRLGVQPKPNGSGLELKPSLNVKF